MSEIGQHSLTFPTRFCHRFHDTRLPARTLFWFSLLYLPVQLSPIGASRHSSNTVSNKSVWMSRVCACNMEEAGLIVWVGRLKKQGKMKPSTSWCTSNPQKDRTVKSKIDWTFTKQMIIYCSIFFGWLAKTDLSKSLHLHFWDSWDLNPQWSTNAATKATCGLNFTRSQRTPFSSFISSAVASWSPCWVVPSTKRCRCNAWSRMVQIRRLSSKCWVTSSAWCVNHLQVHFSDPQSLPPLRRSRAAMPDSIIVPRPFSNISGKLPIFEGKNSNLSDFPSHFGSSEHPPGWSSRSSRSSPHGRKGLPAAIATTARIAPGDQDTIGANRREGSRGTLQAEDVLRKPGGFSRDLWMESVKLKDGYNYVYIYILYIYYINYTCLM